MECQRRDALSQSHYLDDQRRAARCPADQVVDQGHMHRRLHAQEYCTQIHQQVEYFRFQTGIWLELFSIEPTQPGH